MYSLELANFFALAAERAYPAMHNQIAELNVKHADVFVHPAVAGYVASTDTDVILAFRGSKARRAESDELLVWLDMVMEDWSVNLKASPIQLAGGMVHGGFLTAFSPAWNTIARMLETHGADQKNLWITGHSLGGALAQVAGHIAFADRGWQASGVYTYGAPRIGDKAFAAQYAAPVYRFENKNDLISHLPPTPEMMEVLRRIPPLRDFVTDHLGTDFWTTRFRAIGELRFLNWHNEIVDDYLDVRRWYWLVEAALRTPEQLINDHWIEAYTSAIGDLKLDIYEPETRILGS